MTVALLLGALLAAGCVVLVALPYLREPSHGGRRARRAG